MSGAMKLKVMLILIKYMTQKDKQLNEIGERFDERFSVLEFAALDGSRHAVALPEDMRGKIKQFIREEQEAIVKAQMNSLLEEVEGRLKKLKEYPLWNDYVKAEAHTLEDIKALITKRL